MKRANFRCVKENSEGFGLINYNNEYIPIKGMLIDEEGEFEINKNSKNPLKLIKITKKNDALREKPECPFYKECQGCTYQGIKYEHELTLKEEYIKECFSHFRDFTFLGIEQSYNISNYRNKSQKVYKLSKSKRPVCGFYTNTKQLVSITDCKIEAKKIIEVINKFNVILSSNKIDPYDEYTKKGVVKGLTIRYAFNTKELMLVIETASEMFPGRNNIVKDLIRSELNITTIIQSYNKKERILFGKGSILDTILGYKFVLLPNSFYPVNSLGYEALVKDLKKIANFKNTDVVLDINSNISILDIILSSSVNKIIALDSAIENTKIATTNIKLNNIKNIETFTGKSEILLPKLKDNQIDTIIINGSEVLNKDIVNKLRDFKAKKLIYISNDVQNLEKNAFLLGSSNYSLKTLKGYDLAPRTMQTSLVAIFDHKVENFKKEYKNR